MSGTCKDNRTATSTSTMNRRVVPVNLIQVVKYPVSSNNLKVNSSPGGNATNPNHDHNLWNAQLQFNVEAGQIDIPKNIPTNVVQRVFSQRFQISGNKIQHLLPDLAVQDTESVGSLSRQDHDEAWKKISSEQLMHLDDYKDENVSDALNFVVCENEVHEIVSMQELEQQGDKNLVNKADISVPCPKAQSDSQLRLNIVHRKPTLDQNMHPVSSVSSLDLLKHDENWEVVSEFHSVSHEQIIPTVVDRPASLDGVAEKESCERDMFASTYTQDSHKKIAMLSKQAVTDRVWTFKEFSPVKARRLPKQSVLPGDRDVPRKTVSLTGQTSHSDTYKGPSIYQGGKINGDHVFYLQVPRNFSLVNTPPVSKETGTVLVDRTIETDIHDPAAADADAEPELESMDDADSKRRHLLEEMSVLLAKMQGDSGLDAKDESSNPEEPEKLLPYKVSECRDKIELVAIKQEPLDTDTSEHVECPTASSASVNKDIKLVSIKQEPVSDDDLSYVGGRPEEKVETLPGHVGCGTEQVDKLRAKEEVFQNTTNQTLCTIAEYNPCKLDRGLFDLFSKGFPVKDKDYDMNNEMQKVGEICPKAVMKVTCDGKLSKDDLLVPNKCAQDVEIPFDDLSKDSHSVCSRQKVLFEQCTKANTDSHQVKPSDKTVKLKINGQHGKSDKMSMECKMAKVRSAKRKSLAQERKTLAQERKTLAQGHEKIAKKDGQVSRQIKELLQLCSEADEFSQQKGVGNEGCSKRKRRRLTKQEAPLHMSFGVTERRPTSPGHATGAGQGTSDHNVIPGLSVQHQDRTSKKRAIDEKHEIVKSKPKSELQMNRTVSPVTNTKCAIDEQHETANTGNSEAKIEPQIKQLVIRLENISELPLVHGSSQDFVKRREEKEVVEESIQATTTPDSKNCVKRKNEKQFVEASIQAPMTPDSKNCVKRKKDKQFVEASSQATMTPDSKNCVKRKKDKQFVEASIQAPMTPDSKNCVKRKKDKQFVEASIQATTTTDSKKCVKRKKDKQFVEASSQATTTPDSKNCVKRKKDKQFVEASIQATTTPDSKNCVKRKQFVEVSIQAQRTPDSKNSVGENSITRKKAVRVSRQIQELLDICAEAEVFIDQDVTAEELTTGLFKRKSRRLSKQKQTSSNTSSPNSPKPSDRPVSCKETNLSKPTTVNRTEIVDLEGKVKDDTVSQESRQGEDCPVRGKTSLAKKSQTSKCKLLIEITNGSVSCKEMKSSKPKAKNLTEIVNQEAKVKDDSVSQECPVRDKTSFLKKSEASNCKLLIEITNKRKGESKHSKNVKPTSNHKHKKVKVLDFSASTNDSRTRNDRSKNNGTTKEQAISVEDGSGDELLKHSDYTGMGRRMSKDSRDTIVSENTSKPEASRTASFVTEDGESEVGVIEDASRSRNEWNRRFHGSAKSELPLYKKKKLSVLKIGDGDRAISRCNVNTVLSPMTLCNENTGLKTWVSNSVYSKYVNTSHSENAIRVCEGDAVGDQVGLFADHRVCELDTVEETIELVEDKSLVVGDQRVVYESGVYMNNHKCSAFQTDVAQVSKDCDRAIVVSTYEDISDGDDNEVLCHSKDIVSVYDDISDDEVCVDEHLQMKTGLLGGKHANPSCDYEVISDDEYFKGDSENSPILADGDSLCMYNDSKFKGTLSLQDQCGLDRRIVPKNLDNTVLDNKKVSCRTLLMEQNGSTIGLCGGVLVLPVKLKLDNMNYKCDVCPWRCGNARQAVKHRLGHALHRLTISCQLSMTS